MNSKVTFNIIGFYICWWFSIFAAANENYYLGPVLVFIFLKINVLKVINYNHEILFLFI